MIDEKDFVKYENFIRIINEGKFELQGKAITTVASLQIWFQDFKDKVEEQSKLHASLKEKVIELNGENEELKLKCERLEKEVSGFKDTNEKLREENQKLKPKSSKKAKKKTATKKIVKTNSLPSDQQIIGKLEDL